ncbi:MAG: ABC transporter substrate-binding protein [Rhodospirillaceae bacterium]|jgi:TRAP-type mannitol/chloroaromatic compound transport system substrate-binding protein|uniref:TRAP transporter substrate-binding protein n=1 Tax=unclassified Hwanghaeella TaxID=2605944 RepID=UPI000C3913AF|nr:ABC transporter substrate-binding protein [Rhodospirillales bacterium]MAX46934.1 ABC transporter substrate-binding protein [Rhodospirillaceae bacterium]|tara:strand:- start:136646 stop:137746 length:1101 start_codon:yes stop_codon:yes gene_type:complete
MKRRDFLKAGTVAAGAAAVTAASNFAKPAIAQQRIEMNIVSTWPRDFPGLGTGAQRFAQRVQDITDGRIQVQYFAAGERVGAFDAFDEVASGNAQAYHGADYYWKGKHPAWAYFTTVPFGLTYTEINAWIRFMGGQQLWDELGAEFGLKGLMCGNTGGQMGGWFNKEINSADDLRGLKMRMPGLGGDVIAKLGASPVSLPGGQIYENLVSGAIDATEWVGPWNDYAMKLYEAAKYYYYPGFHEPGSMLAVGMNKSWWEGLSPMDQMLIESAATVENDVMMSEFNANNGTYLTKLVKEQGVVVKKFNDDVYDAYGKASAELFEEVKAHSDLAARVHESFFNTRAELGSWGNLQDVEYVVQRNRVLGL